jgi:hypothetical protein
MDTTPLRNQHVVIEADSLVGLPVHVVMRASGPTGRPEIVDIYMSAVRAARVRDSLADAAASSDGPAVPAYWVEARWFYPGECRFPGES